MHLMSVLAGPAGLCCCLLNQQVLDVDLVVGESTVGEELKGAGCFVRMGSDSM